MCFFYIVFGRDANVGAKCKRLQEPKYWSTSLFRVDNYCSHMRSQHASKWSECQLLNSTDDRLAFFQFIKVPYVNTLHAHFINEGDEPRFWINKSIFEIIIGEIFFHSDDVECMTHMQTLTIFQFVDEDEVNGHEVYFDEIKTEKQFQSTIKLVAPGDFFCTVSRQLQVFNQHHSRS